MPLQTDPFKEIRFTGGRFDETAGWLDLGVVGELQRYHQIIVAVASENWRQAHDGRERLPTGFTSSFSLGIAGQIEAGSCSLAIVRHLPDSKQLPMDDYFDNAAQIIDETLLAVRNGAPFPPGMTTSVLPMFGKWCQSLREDESIILGTHNGHSPAFNAIIRARLVARIPGNQPYFDDVDLTGEVRAADLSNQAGGSFRIRLDNGVSIPGVFTDAQEASITAALRDHSEVRLRITGQGRFAPSGQLQRIRHVDNHEIIPTGQTLFDEAAPSILDIFDAIHRSMPEGAFDDLPTDGGRNYKHYLYSWPKEDER